jgi:hypothetical protein
MNMTHEMNFGGDKSKHFSIMISQESEIANGGIFSQQDPCLQRAHNRSQHIKA